MIISSDFNLFKRTFYLILNLINVVFHLHPSLQQFLFYLLKASLIPFVLQDVDQRFAFVHYLAYFVELFCYGFLEHVQVLVKKDSYFFYIFWIFLPENLFRLAQSIP